MVVTKLRSPQRHDRRVFHCPIVRSSVTRTLKPEVNRPSPELNYALKIILDHGEFIIRLDITAIAAVQTAQHLHYTLKPPPELLSSLRRYTLVDYYGRPQSGLTFYTCYADMDQGGSSCDLWQNSQVLLRTVVAVDGDIINQIHDSLLSQPLGREITAAHHWIISNLLADLHADWMHYANLALKTIPIVTVSATVISQVNTFMQDPASAVPPIALSCLSFLLPLARKQIIQFLWRTLLSPKFWLNRLLKR